MPILQLKKSQSRFRTQNFMALHLGLFIFLFLFLSTDLCSQVSKITPELQKLIETTPPGKKIPIIVVMSAKYVFPPYTVVLKEQRDEIFKERIQQLKNFNANDQKSLLSYLEENEPRVEDVKSNLIKNYVSLKATTDLIEALSLRDDVSFLISYDATRFSDEKLSDSDLNIVDSSKDFRTNVERLSDSNPLVRRNALIYLSNERNPQSLEHILKMINDGDPFVRRTAVESLSNFVNPRVSSRISRALIDLLRVEKDVPVKLAIIKVLGDLKHISSVEPLKSLLKDPYPLFRGEAVKALGKINDPTTYPHIVSMISDEAEGVRIAAMEVSGRLRLNSAILSVVKNLKDPVASVRKVACEVLGLIGGASEIEALESILQTEKDAEVRTVAENSLVLIRGRLRRR